MTLKNLRDLAGLTQRQAATSAGIARSRLSEIESGEISPGPEEEVRLRRTLIRAIGRRGAQISRLLESQSAAREESAPLTHAGTRGS